MGLLVRLNAMTQVKTYGKELLIHLSLIESDKYHAFIHQWEFDDLKSGYVQ